MSNIPIEDLKALIRDTIYDTLYRQYYLMPKVTFPTKNLTCKHFTDFMVGERPMVHPCDSLREVMKEPGDFQLGEMTEFNFLKFEESKIKFCPFCGVKFK